VRDPVCVENDLTGKTYLRGQLPWTCRRHLDAELGSVRRTEPNDRLRSMVVVSFMTGMVVMVAVRMCVFMIILVVIVLIAFVLLVLFMFVFVWIGRTMFGMVVNLLRLAAGRCLLGAHAR
jgi:hypothetical protein